MVRSSHEDDPFALPRPPFIEGDNLATIDAERHEWLYVLARLVARCPAPMNYKSKVEGFSVSLSHGRRVDSETCRWDTEPAYVSCGSEHDEQHSPLAAGNRPLKFRFPKAALRHRAQPPEKTARRGEPAEALIYAEPVHCRSHDVPCHHDPRDLRLARLRQEEGTD